MVNRCLLRNRTDKEHRKLWMWEQCLFSFFHQQHDKHVSVSCVPSEANVHNAQQRRGGIWGCLMKLFTFSFLFWFGGEIFRIASHYSWTPGPLAGRSPTANINNQAWTPCARRHSNPTCTWQQNRAEHGHSGSSSSNPSKVFQTGKSVQNNHCSLEGKLNKKNPLSKQNGVES